MDPSNETTMLRVGVVGLGMGRHHVEAFSNHPNAEVVAISDLDPKRLEDIGNQYGVANRYTAFEEMLEKESLDIVGIATPNFLHRPIALAAIAAGCHVFCEKPMAMNAGEAQEMIDAANAAGRRIMIDFSYRFSDQSQALYAEVQKDTLGDVYFGRAVWLRRDGMPGFGGWFGQKDKSGGGPLIDLGVHRLDFALWLMGYPKPAWVVGATYDHLARQKADAEEKLYDVEDMAVAMIRFENGATLELEASWASHIQEPEFMETRLLGTKAGLLQRNVGGGYAWETELYYHRDGEAVDHKLEIPEGQGTTGPEHFVDSIVSDSPHMATGEEGLIVMKILDAIYASAERNEPVILNG
jgi:predicted dehydrogenase